MQKNIIRLRSRKMRCIAFVVAVVGQVLLTGPLALADEATELELLKGTWICVESFKEGKRVDSYVGVRAVFDGNNMTWIYPRPNGDDRRQACRFDIDVRRNPKYFDWYAAERPQERYLRLYKIENDMLYWATDISTAERPKSFDDATWTFRCRKFRTSSRSSN